MSEEEKAPFVDPYLDEKASFIEDLAVYKASGREQIWHSGGITSAKKPFLIFLDCLKEEGHMEGKNAIEFAKFASARWQQLSEDERGDFSQQHKMMQEMYALEQEQKRNASVERRKKRKEQLALENSRPFAIMDDVESNPPHVDDDIKDEPR